MWLVFQSAFVARGRHPYYVYNQKPEVSEKDKEDFKKDISKMLIHVSTRDTSHIEKIKTLQVQISEKWKDVLFEHEKSRPPYLKNQTGGWFTFGRAQKLLNLYLKYQWVFNQPQSIDPPPHCPIDAIILREIKWLGPPWTSPEFTEEKYRKAIEHCEERAREEEKSLAVWELCVFNNRNKIIDGK